MELTLQVLILLFLVAILAGWVDAVAGGGGLLTVPALLLVGLPPAAAIATNKLQGTSGTFTAALYFLSKGVISLKANVVPVLAACVGAMLGGFVLTMVDTQFLNYLIPVLLILTAIYYWLFAGNLDAGREPLLSKTTYNASVAPALGFYDGFFGPGTGTFMTTSLVTLRGSTIRDATALAKLLNFSSNLAALVYFVFFGQIAWLAGFSMMAGQIVGAYLGAKVALDVGAKLIRPLIIVMCLAMSLSALWKLLVSS